MSFIVKQKIKGQIYVYKATGYWDKDKKQARQKRIFIGKEDPNTGKTIPTKKDIRPKSCKDYGNFYFLNNIAEKIGLTKILKTIFPSEWSKILTCAFFEVSEKRPLYLCESWVETTYSDQVETMPSQRISELLKQLGRNVSERIEFSKLWAKKREDKEYIAFDITSISSYSKLIELVENGYNRDKERLPQINLGMLFGQSSLLPIFYNVYQGSIRDVSTLKNIIKFTEHFELRNVRYVLDKGFYSADNIKEMCKKRLKFIVSVPFTVDIVKELVKKHRENICAVSKSFRLNKQILYGMKCKTRIEENYLNAYIFFDKRKQLEAEEYLVKKLVEIEENVMKKNFQSRAKLEKYLDGKFSSWKDFFMAKKKNKKFIAEKIEEGINETLKHKGYIIILSNCGIDKKEIISLYRSKDSVEKAFDNMKNELDIKRLRVHSDDAMAGRLFIGFIALILYSWISKVMKEKNLYKSYTIEELMRELKKIKIIEFSKDKKMITELSKKQNDLFKNFKIKLISDTLL